jgi:hypothetical protein
MKPLTLGSYKINVVRRTIETNAAMLAHCSRPGPGIAALAQVDLEGVWKIATPTPVQITGESTLPLLSKAGLDI